MGSISILRRKQLISSLLNNACSFVSTSNKSCWSASMMSCMGGDYKRILQPSTTQFFKNAFHSFSTGAVDDQVMKEELQRELLHLDINQQIGTCMPLRAMRIGTIIHNIELKPGQGGKLVRAAGTSAKILKEPGLEGCVVRLPSGAEKVIDSRCRATVGVVSNPSHEMRKLGKAGRSRWLGRRPVVRGVAMNPVDHPHGGGEGRSKSSGSFGRVSQTPWGKPTKSGYKTGALRHKTGALRRKK